MSAGGDETAPAPAGIGQRAKGACLRLARSVRAGWLLLSGSDERIAAEPAERFRDAPAGLLAASLATGIASCALWAAAWRVFGEPAMTRFMPAVLTAAMLILWPLRRAVAGAIDIACGRDPSARPLAAALFVLAFTLCMVLVSLEHFHLEKPWPAWLAWLRLGRRYKFYRVLLLMPLWGAWAMLITPRFCRPDERTEPAVAAFARAGGPFRATICMGLLLAATIKYFAYLPWQQLNISAAAMVTGPLAGAVLCRRTGGLTRRALLAANVATQMVFMLAYLATRNLVT